MAEFSNSFKTDSSFKAEHEELVKKPDMYKVIMHNDHYTTMDFVVEVLVSIFNKAAPEATNIMMNIHKKGNDVCGVFTLDIAQTKIDQVHTRAKSNNYPLKCTYEKA